MPKVFKQKYRDAWLQHPHFNTRRGKGYTRFVGKYVTGRRRTYIIRLITGMGCEGTKNVAQSTLYKA